MDPEKYLEKYEAQKKIDKLSKKYKNRKIVLYGADEFSNKIFENYDLSKLNIVAVCDKRFAEIENPDYYNYKCISPDELGDFDCDLILISSFDYDKFLTFLDDHVLYKKKNEAIEIRPLIKLGFKDIFLRK